MRDLPEAHKWLPMTLAESASTLAEGLVASSALAEAEGEWALHLLDKRLQRAIHFLVEMPARFELERALFEMRREGPLDADRLRDRTRAIYERHYGGTLASVNPLKWASQLHFYLTRHPLYNVPYTSRS